MPAPLAPVSLSPAEVVRTCSPAVGVVPRDTLASRPAASHGGAAAAGSSRGMAPAVFAGVQEGIGPIAAFAIYNLTADIEGYPKGSTVCADTLLRQGYALPQGQPTKQTSAGAAIAGLAPAEQGAPVVEVVRHPAGGWTHARQVPGTARRIYEGVWATAAAARQALALGGGRGPARAALGAEVGA